MVYLEMMPWRCLRAAMCYAIVHGWRRIYRRIGVDYLKGEGGFVGGSWIRSVGRIWFDG